METILTGLLKLSPDNFLFRGLAPSNSYYEKPAIRFCNRYGLNYKLDISDYQNWLLYFYCKTDSSFGVVNYIKNGDIILDMGGNIGQTAMMMAKFAGKTSKVFSFEPFPETYEKFVTNLELNPELKDNVSIENCALGNTVSVLQMYRDCETNSGSNRMVSKESVSKELIQVPVSTIDIFVQENNLTKLDLIKIDVEGFEMNVLKGAENTLKKFHPKLFIELNDKSLKDQGSGAMILISFLKELGYCIFEDGKNTELCEKDFCRHIDIFCRPSI
jgi:FkbM family methyltransferase